MGVYLEPIKMAMIAFPIMAFMISLPIFLYQYYKHVTFLRWYGLVIYSFMLYLIVAYFLVILPLPDREEVAKFTTARYSLQPFQFVRAFIEETSLIINQPATYLSALKESVVIQPVFNIFLTIPFGIYMRYLFKKDLKTTFLLSFGFSLFFELTQLSGLYGYYPRSYRLFDVDDLFLNTLGGLIGYGMTPLVEKLFPREEALKRRQEKSAKQVSYIKRGVTYLTDWLVFTWLLGIVEGFLGNGYLISVLSFFIYYFVVPVTIFDGQTLAQKVTGLKMITETGEKISKKALFIRQLLFGINCFIINVLLSNALIATGTVPDEQLDVVLYMVFILTFYTLVFVLHVLYNIITKDKQLFYEDISKTILISTK
ncbi:VanZ family protein [Vagococcus zengguangii]|uniref:Uncharacterized protein n=1 Tax=Vagococcus zengguangii TaxID=2571750 RepID=A0A4D7CQC8_9ENTE|nr:VanZ family protein [Vagococcus zengguangii]QCI86375.1 hypothetical protein FA707_05080 [Vagococcus zengguangii]TLG81375.1 hypothetical protein FE258_02530 [Vagococcus zengguangii]